MEVRTRSGRFRPVLPQAKPEDRQVTASTAAVASLARGRGARAETAAARLSVAFVN